MGSMVELGENIRINVELIDGTDNSTLWGETYTRPRSAVYQMEEYLSKEIADALGIQLTGEQEERLTRRHTENSEAREAYLKGRAEVAKLTAISLQEAIPYFEKAIEMDPNYGPAYTGLADTYVRLAQGGDAISHAEAIPKAEELAFRALELDATLGEAHGVLGDAQRVYHWDWVEAEREFKLALFDGLQRLQ